MKGLYLLMYIGFEGIEKVLLPTMDKQEVLDKYNELRQEIIDAKEKRIELNLVEDENLDYADEWKRIMKLVDENPEYYDIINKSDMDDIFYCIQQFDGNDFKCVCKDLGVGSNKTIYY